MNMSRKPFFTSGVKLFSVSKLCDCTVLYLQLWFKNKREETKRFIKEVMNQVLLLDCYLNYFF